MLDSTIAKMIDTGSDIEEDGFMNGVGIIVGVARVGAKAANAGFE